MYRKQTKLVHFQKLIRNPGPWLPTPKDGPNMAPIWPQYGPKMVWLVVVSCRCCRATGPQENNVPEQNVPRASKPPCLRPPRGLGGIREVETICLFVVHLYFTIQKRSETPKTHHAFAYPTRYALATGISCSSDPSDVCDSSGAHADPKPIAKMFMLLQCQLPSPGVDG